MTGWITRRHDRLGDDQAQQLKEILARSPELRRPAEHVRDFGQLMSNRQGRQLCHWIEHAQADDLPAPHIFINGSAKTATPSSPASACPTALARLKATTTRSKC
ncbi:hypothetical protein ACWGDT_00145 [Streptomyces avermitilis]